MHVPPYERFDFGSFLAEIATLCSFVALRIELVPRPIRAAPKGPPQDKVVRTISESGAFVARTVMMGCVAVREKVMLGLVVWCAHTGRR